MQAQLEQNPDELGMRKMTANARFAAGQPAFYDLARRRERTPGLTAQTCGEVDTWIVALFRRFGFKSWLRCFSRRWL